MTIDSKITKTGYESMNEKSISWKVETVTEHSSGARWHLLGIR